MHACLAVRSPRISALAPPPPPPPPPAHNLLSAPKGGQEQTKHWCDSVRQRCSFGVYNAWGSCHTESARKGSKVQRRWMSSIESAMPPLLRVSFFGAEPWEITHLLDDSNGYLCAMTGAPYKSYVVIYHRWYTTKFILLLVWL